MTFYFIPLSLISLADFRLKPNTWSRWRIFYIKYVVTMTPTIKVENRPNKGHPESLEVSFEFVEGFPELGIGWSFMILFNNSESLTSYLCISLFSFGSRLHPLGTLLRKSFIGRPVLPTRHRTQLQNISFHFSFLCLILCLYYQIQKKLKFYHKKI